MCVDMVLYVWLLQHSSLVSVLNPSQIIQPAASCVQKWTANNEQKKNNVNLSRLLPGCAEKKNKSIVKQEPSIRYIRK